MNEDEKKEGTKVKTRKEEKIVCENYRKGNKHCVVESSYAVSVN